MFWFKKTYNKWRFWRTLALAKALWAISGSSGSLWRRSLVALLWTLWLFFVVLLRASLGEASHMSKIKILQHFLSPCSLNAFPFFQFLSNFFLSSRFDLAITDENRRSLRYVSQRFSKHRVTLPAVLPIMKSCVCSKKDGTGAIALSEKVRRMRNMHPT